MSIFHIINLSLNKVLGLVLSLVVFLVNNTVGKYQICIMTLNNKIKCKFKL